MQAFLDISGFHIGRYIIVYWRSHLYITSLLFFNGFLRHTSRIISDCVTPLMDDMSFGKPKGVELAWKE